MGISCVESGLPVEPRAAMLTSPILRGRLPATARIGRCVMAHKVLFRLAFCLCLLGVLGVGSASSIAWADQPTSEDAAALVGHCRELAEISKGVCSMLGCSDATIPLAMARSGGFFIHAQVPRPVVVDAVRDATDAEGLYGNTSWWRRGTWHGCHTPTA